jgi:hypothetical protein
MSLKRQVVSILTISALAACGGSEPAAEPQRQIQLAPPPATPAPIADVAPKPETKAAKSTVKKAEAPPPPAPQREPEKKVEAPAPAPVAVAPAPAPAPTAGTIAEGSTFSVVPSAKICTNTHKTGDTFTAALTQPLSGTNGAQIPAGAVATLRIVEASRETTTDSLHLTYDILSVKSGDQTYEVNAHVTQSAPLERFNTQSKSDATRKVAAGALIGAIAGRVLGKDTRGAVVGGAVGAAAGAAMAARASKIEGCLKPDGTITLVLDRPLTLKLDG